MFLLFTMQKQVSLSWRLLEASA